MGTHPIFESDFDCLTEGFFSTNMSEPVAKKAKTESDEDLPKEVLELQKFQDQLEELNEKASEEILKVEQKYNKQRKPLFESRQQAISKLDKSMEGHEKFWARAFGNHPFLAPMMSTEELEMMSSLTAIEVAEDEDIKSGFSIRFKFEKNEFFTNDVIEKKYHMTTEGDVTNSTTPIVWKKGKNITERDDCECEFTKWLIENTDETSDDVADLIKDDLWQNPYQYYLGVAESDDEDEEVIEEAENGKK